VELPALGQAINGGKVSHVLEPLAIGQDHVLALERLEATGISNLEIPGDCIQVLGDLTSDPGARNDQVDRSVWRKKSDPPPV
jgi:hypothetical protein